MSKVILEVEGLKKYFPISKGKQKGMFVKAIDGIDFNIKEGETLGLVGESGVVKKTFKNKKRYTNGVPGPGNDIKSTEKCQANIDFTVVNPQHDR